MIGIRAMTGVLPSVGFGADVSEKETDSKLKNDDSILTSNEQSIQE